MCAKLQVYIMTRTQNTGHCLRPPTKIIQNPYQVLTNVKCYNFCIKHCFYLKFAMFALFVKWNQTKVIFSRFFIFRVFRVFPDLKDRRNRMNCEKSGIFMKLPFLWNILREKKGKIPSLIGILWYKCFLPQNQPFWAYFNWLRHQNINFSKILR